MGLGVTLQDAIDRSRVTDFPIEAELDLLFAISVNDRVTMAKEIERLQAIVDAVLKYPLQDARRIAAEAAKEES